MTYTPEIEFKFFPKNREIVLKNLSEKATKKQERTLFRAAACRREDNPHFRDLDVIRVRDEGTGIYLTMKQWFVDGQEIDHAMEKDFLVSNFDYTIDMFNNLGLLISIQSEKYRTTWDMDECEIVLDENPWLEPYFEIEGPSEAHIKDVCNTIGCEWETKRDGGTRILYIEKYGERARTVRNITFAENPFTL